MTIFSASTKSYLFHRINFFYLVYFIKILFWLAGIHVRLVHRKDKTRNLQISYIQESFNDKIFQVIKKSFKFYDADLYEERVINDNDNDNNNQ